MKRKCIFSFLILFAIILFSCEKEEIPIASFSRGDAIISSVNMEADYRYQVYFDLYTNSIVKTIEKTEWDVALLCGISQKKLTINSSKFMFVSKTSSDDLFLVTDTTGFAANKKLDASSGNADSTAFGNLELNVVYIVDRGRNSDGSAIGFSKMLITDTSQTAIYFKYADISSTEINEGEIQIDSLFNSVGFSFNTGAQIFHEPLLADYDIIFTQYTYYFTEFGLPYLVTGVLQNRHNTVTARDTVNNFFSITTINLDNYVFTEAADAIGYDWKSFALDLGIFTVFPDMNYIIRDAEGYYFKLHFIDFYNDAGEKGNPVFEFQFL